MPQERAEELLAELRAAEGMWTTYRRLHRAGLRVAQESVRERYQRLRLLRGYQTRGVPGLLQTADYTRAALMTVREEENLRPDDADLNAAVAERMNRQMVLRRGMRPRTFLFVVEEDTLWYRPYPRQVHIDQLRYLRQVATGRLASVVFGVIPRTVGRHGVRPRESFIITDDALVSVEMVSGYLRISTPDEVAMYVQAWERLNGLTVVGDEAAALVDRALDDLGGGG